MRCVEDMAFALKQWQELPIGRERDEVGCEVGIFGGCTTCMALTFLMTSHMM